MARRIWGKRHGGNGKHQMGRLQQTLALLAVLAAGTAAAALLGGSSYALTLVTGGTTETNLSFLSTGPTIDSDQPDYNPGATVTLTGHNWADSEQVHITVNDDRGQTWSYSSDVVADASGDFTLHFTLPTSFVATYTATATGAISGTARTTFTDGNVKFDVAPTGTTAQFVEHIFQGSTNCTGTEQTNGGFPKTLTGSNGDNVGVGSTDSVRIDAALTSDAGGSFTGWSTTDGSPFTVSGTNGRSICVPGFQSGTRNYRATYAPPNQPPTINRNNAAVTVNEPTNATNTGTWSDPNAGDTVTLSASVGTVTKSGSNASGTWSWSFGPTDGPADNQTVTITANDGTTSTSTTFTLTVNNLPPSISTVTNNGPINEGGSATITVNATDPAGTRDPLSYEFDCNNDGTFEVGPQAANTNACSYNDDGSRQVNVRVSDGDGGTATGSTTVTVNNVAPTGTLANNGPVDEGSPATITFSAPSDPSSVDTAAGFHYSYACDGNAASLATTYAGATDGTSKQCTFADGPSIHVVKGRIFDKDNGSSTFDTTVTVRNVAPNVSAAANQASNEGSTASFNLGSFTDPGANDNPWSVEINWGDGSAHTTLTQATQGGLGSQSHKYDDSGTYTVTVTVKDKDNDSGNATFQVSVANIAPTATLANNGAVNEGSPVSISFSGQSDPSNADTIAGFHYAYACDNSSLAGATYGGSGASASTTCTFPDNGTKTVRARIIDKDGGFTEYTTAVTVNNVNPIVSVSDQMAVEGTLGSFHLGSFSDPGTTDNPWKVHVDWGDGTDSNLPDFNTQGSLGDAPHTYADGLNDYMVTVTVTDKDGGVGSATFKVTVVNSPPVVTAPANQSADEGSSTSFNLGSFTDKGVNDNPWSIAVNWGDGNSNTYSQVTQGTIAAQSHTYDDGPHTYTVSVKVTDKDGGNDTKTFQVTVANVAPTAALSNDGPTDEGANATISFSGQHDPSTADTTAGFHYTYACDGNAATLATSYATALMGASATCSFPDGPTSHPVLARIYDKDGGHNDYSTNVDVRNANPVATAPADQTVGEGTAKSFALGSFTDAGIMDDPWTIYVQWGDSTSSSFSQNAQGGITSTSHTYADNGTYTVTVNVADKDGGSSNTTTFKISVANLAPVVSGQFNQSSNEGQNASFDLGSFSDKGTLDSPWKVHVDWGDSSSSDPADKTTQGSLGNASHAYADNGVYTVTVQVTDKDDDSGQNTFSVTVANVAPTASLANNGPVEEGSPATVTFSNQFDPSGADTSAGFHYAYACDNGSLSGATYATAETSASHQCAFPDNGTYPVKARIIDKDGGYTQYTTNVSVTNAAPKLTPPSDDTGLEGSSKSFGLGAFSDAGVNDNPWLLHITWGDGSAADDLSYNAQGPLGMAPHSYDDNGVYTVTERITDKDGGFDTQTFKVTVDNVAPTADLGNDGPINEGASATVSFSNQLDPSSADTSTGFHYAFSCTGGDLSASTYAGAGTSASTSCSFADNGSYPVKARIIDKDNGYTEYTTTVVVKNVAPTVTSGGNQSSNEGSAHDFALGSFSDPGTNDGPWHVLADWGDGSTSDGDRTAQGGLGVSSHTYDDNGTYHVTVTVTDKDGGSGSASFDVTVANVAPTATLSNSGPVSEGSPATVSFSNELDPSSADTSAGFHYAYDCNGSSLAGSTYASSGTSSSKSCTFPDNGSYPVSGRIIDKDGGYTDYTTSVTVNNAAPVVTAAADQSSNEGSSASFDLGSFSDAGVNDSPWSADVNWGDGSSHTTFPTTSQGSLGSQSHTYADNGSYTVTVKMTDKDNGYGSATFTINVANVAPTATLSNSGPVNEGGSATISFSSEFDPSSVDTAAGFHYAFACDGGSLAGATYGGSAASASTTCPFNDNGTYPVRARIIDKDDGYTEYTTSVTVNSVAPTASLNNNGPVFEGSPVVVSFSSQFDPSSADTAAGFHYAYDCHGGSLAGATYAGSGTNASTSCTFDDGPSTPTVRARIIDKDGDYTEYTTQVVVNNANPTASISNNGPVSEGAPATVTLSSPSDPSNADTAAGFHYAFSCTNGDLSGATYAGSGTGGSTSCTFDDNGTYTVKARIIDKDGGYSQYTTAVSITNVNPTATLANDGSVDEGSPATVSFSNQFDPSGADTTSGFHYAFSCTNGDLSAATYAGSGTSASTTCTFNDNGSYPVNGRIIDKNNGYTEYTTTVTVKNVAPNVTSGGDQSSNEGETKAFNLGSFTDPGADTWAVHVDWGDGSSSDGTRSAAGGLGTSNHKYDDNGTYHVTVTVTDDDGGSGSASFDVAVANVAPTATLSNNGPVSEGSPATVSFSNQFDPSGADTSASFRYAYDCSGGSLAGATYAGSGTSTSRSCTFADNGTYPVSGRIIDKNGGYSDYTTNITVTNAAPIVTAPSDQSASEGSGTSFNLGSFSDAGVNDGSWAVDVDWGDGLPHATFSATSQGSLGSQVHIYVNDGTYTVTAKVTDKDGGYGSATFKVTVANVTPAVTAPADQTADEGTSKSFNLGSFTDPGADNPWAVDVDWGDGTAHDTFNNASPGSLGTRAHTYADNGTYTVTVKVTEKGGSGASGQATFKVAVANVPPTVTSFTGSNVLAGGLVFGLSGSFTGSFTDPGLVDNQWTVSFTWDGVPDPTTQSIGQTTPPSSTHSFTVRPQFTAGGCNKTATVKVTDKDGGYGTRSATVQVGTGEFLPPMTNQPVTDKLKNGQVLPVKVRIADCNGNPITGLSPTILLKKGDLTDGVQDDSTMTVTPDSVSAADTTGVMRYADGFYIYNMRVNLPNADLGTNPYTVVISPGISGYVGTMQLRHKILATK